MSVLRVFLFGCCSLLLAGCWGSGVKNDTISICEQLDDNDEWIMPLLRAEKQFSTPISVQLSLLEFPGPGRGGKYVYARSGDWDEFRMRTERWDASAESMDDSINYVAWFSQQSRERNQIDGHAAGEHFLSMRLGHGAYHRMERGSLPDLERTAEQVSMRAQRWRSELMLCRSQWKNESWFNALKFW